jgi:hypothetical protein
MLEALPSRRNRDHASSACPLNRGLAVVGRLMTSRRNVLVALATVLALGLCATDRAGADTEHRYRLHVSGMT